MTLNGLDFIHSAIKRGRWIKGPFKRVLGSYQSFCSDRTVKLRR